MSRVPPIGLFNYPLRCGVQLSQWVHHPAVVDDLHRHPKHESLEDRVLILEAGVPFSILFLTSKKLPKPHQPCVRCNVLRGREDRPSHRGMSREDVREIRHVV